MDAKVVVDAIRNGGEDDTEFGLLIRECRSCLDKEEFFSLCFVKRQVNQVAHTLARASRFYTSPYVSFEAPSCLGALLDDDCNDFALS
ncbi:hypothetical protein PTKIN_Ptkin17bG0109100 [Pterospermum kingtungense]